MDLSIIIAAFAMQREAPRTLRSLLPPLQRGIEGLDYEIIVIDHGSPVPLMLPDFADCNVPVRLVRVDNAPQSPVQALNDAALTLAHSENVMLCIDGARICSPYVVARSVAQLRLHPEAFVYVTSRHLGPKVQMISCQEGYDQAAEDVLLASVDWETNLDELFKISVWAGACRYGKYYLLSESNAFSLSKRQFDELGGYNEAFLSPGGGLSNLDIFARAVERPNAFNVLLVGESTFHQFHGGAATANAGYFDKSLGEYLKATGRPYAERRYRFYLDLGYEYDRPADVGRYFNL